MICFVCKHSGFTFAALLAHYKIIHLLKPFSSYECCEYDCTQTFSNLNCYKRHIVRKHTTKPINSPTPIPVIKNVSNNNAENECIYTTQNDSIEINDTISIVSDNSCPVTFENDDILNLDGLINSYHTSAVKFTLSLLDNNNFSRKDVFEIQRKVEKYIIEPVENLITSFTQKAVKEPILLSSFQTIKTAFTNTFNFCNSEFSLNNWLIRNNLFQNVQEFTINEEINLVSDSGEIIYGDKTSKGILLQLHFQFKKTFEQNENLANSLSLYEQLINNSSDQTQIKHFVQGELWKKKMLPYQNKIVIPYFMYIDDFEINNPLGFHVSVHSISAIYNSFPLTDQSKLVNILIIYNNIIYFNKSCRH